MKSVLAVLVFSGSVVVSAAGCADYYSEESSDESEGIFGGIFSPGTKTKVTSGQDTPDINEIQMEAYDGPKARIAVSRFTDKTRTGWWSGAIGNGMADQLATTLFGTNRYILLERQTLKDVLYEQDLNRLTGHSRNLTLTVPGHTRGWCRREEQPSSPSLGLH